MANLGLIAGLLGSAAQGVQRGRASSDERQRQAERDALQQQLLQRQVQAQAESVNQRKRGEDTARKTAAEAQLATDRAFENEGQ